MYGEKSRAILVMDFNMYNIDTPMVGFCIVKYGKALSAFFVEQNTLIVANNRRHRILDHA